MILKVSKSIRKTNLLTVGFRTLSTLGILKVYSYAVVIATYQWVVNDKGPNHIRRVADVFEVFVLRGIFIKRGY